MIKKYLRKREEISMYLSHRANEATEAFVPICTMMTSSNGNIFRVTGPGEFPTQRPVTRSFDVFFDLRLNKRLS